MSYDILELFKWTILASMAASSVLAFLGVQLASKAKSVQVLAMSQGAILGVLIGMAASGFSVHEGSELDTHFLPLFFSSIVAFLVSVFGEYITKDIRSSKNTYYVSIFSFLMAFSYFVSALFPALESHMTQVFFGDLATLTNTDSMLTIAFSLICFSFFLIMKNKIINDSFEDAVFGVEKQYFSKESKLENFFISLLSTVFICFSIQFLGLLFTLSCLFIPTAIFAYSRCGSINSHLIFCILASVISSFVGVVWSLFNTSLSTVPCVVLVMVALSSFLVLISKGMSHD